MAWKDKKSVETVKMLRDKFNVKCYIETGTFKGVGARFHASNFEEVYTCEIVEEYYLHSKAKLEKYPNVRVFHQSSPDFLRDFVEKYRKDGRKDIIFVYLDAHFYDPTLPPEKRFVVLDELRALNGFENCIIMIHDFDNNLGHITYDGQPMDLEFLKNDLLNVNKNFKFYTNEISGCDMYNEKTILDSGMVIDFETLDNVRFGNSTPRLNYRGILYAVPDELGSEFTIRKIKNY